MTPINYSRLSDLVKLLISTFFFRSDVVYFLYLSTICWYIKINLLSYFSYENGEHLKTIYSFLNEYFSLDVLNQIFL